MKIRKSELADLEKILRVYEYAREQMRLNGNPSQWGNKYPAESVLMRDIENGSSYLIEENGKIFGVFSFISGPLTHAPSDSLNI